MRLARVGLEAAADHGFVLAGGYAVQAHGFLRRISDDGDLFTDQLDPAAFDTAVHAVRDAYAGSGLTVEVTKRGDTFARLLITDESGRTTKVEMGYDWRAQPPAVVDIGPVLHPDDAVANKVSTVFSRAERPGTTLTWWRPSAPADTPVTTCCAWRKTATRASTTASSSRLCAPPTGGTTRTT